MAAPSMALRVSVTSGALSVPPTTNGMPVRLPATPAVTSTVTWPDGATQVPFLRGTNSNAWEVQSLIAASIGALVAALGAGLVGAIYVVAGIAWALAKVNEGYALQLVLAVVLALCVAAHPFRTTPETRKPSYATLALVLSVIMVVPAIVLAVAVIAEGLSRRPNAEMGLIMMLVGIVAGAPVLRYAVVARRARVQTPALGGSKRAKVAFALLGVLAVALAGVFVLQVMRGVLSRMT